MRSRSPNLFFLVLALVSPSFAASPELPADALGDEVAGILWIDATQLDPVTFTKAVGDSMGKYARPIVDAMNPYLRLHASFVRAGGTSMAIVYFDPYSANAASRGVANPVYLFSMTDPKQRAAIESIVTTASLDEKTQKSTAKFRMMGNWLAAYDGSLVEPLLEKGDEGRAKALRAALKPIAENPAVLAFLPTRRMRAHHAGRIREAESGRIGIENEYPRELRPHMAFVGALLEAESLVITLKLGREPAANMTIRFPDTELATDAMTRQKPMVDAIAAFMKRTHRLLEQITQFSAYLAVLNNVTPQQDGRTISLSASGAVLTRIAEGIGDGLAEAYEEALIVRSINQMKAIIMGLNNYAQDNGGKYPDSLDELSRRGFVKDFDVLIINPRTGRKPGYVYVRPPLTQKELVKDKLTGKTPILYEASAAGRLDAGGLIGFINERVSRPDRGTQTGK